MQKEWLKVISMLVAMNTKDSLKRCCHVHCQNIWHGMLHSLSFMGEIKCMRELGVINSPEFILHKKDSRRRVMYTTEFFCANNSGRRVMCPTESPMSKVWWEVGT